MANEFPLLRHGGLPRCRVVSDRSALEVVTASACYCVFVAGRISQRTALPTEARPLVADRALHAPSAGAAGPVDRRRPHNVTIRVQLAEVIVTSYAVGRGKFVGVRVTGGSGFISHRRPVLADVPVDF